MLSMNLLGLDIGGANLKVADGCGYACSSAFPLWKQPEDLRSALSKALSNAPLSEAVAITMTGELADCFRTKREGVEHILSACHRAMPNHPLHVYLVSGSIVPIEQARETPLLAAAANWHALASFAARFAEEEPALCVDVGSTTTDIIPICGSVVTTNSTTDAQRLSRGELVYTGVARTPIGALVAKLPYRQCWCGCATELFATTRDVYLMLGDLRGSPDDCDTPDGRPATPQYARERLARCVCADAETFSQADAQLAAQHVRQAQLRQIARATRSVLCAMAPQRPKRIIISGQGEFLARQAMRLLPIRPDSVSLADHLGDSVSHAAAAHAVAVLAKETLP